MPKLNKNKFILGVTGNLACGKSTVAAMFKTQDCLLIDADRLGHRFLSAPGLVYKKIINTFGEGILDPDKKINRAKLAKRVFAGKKDLARLNAIVHPVLIKEIKRLIKNSDKKIIILDAALIIEAGLRKIADKLVVVTAKKNQQILRQQKGAGLSREDILSRLKSQISQSKKKRFADFIIDNSGSIVETKKQVCAIRRKLWKS